MAAESPKLAISKKVNFLPFLVFTWPTSNLRVLSAVIRAQASSRFSGMPRLFGDIVLCPCGDDAEVNFTTDHAAHHRFEGAVTTHGDHGLISVFNGLPGDRRGLFFWLGQGHICLDTQFLQAYKDQLQVFGRFSGFSGARVGNQFDTRGLILSLTFRILLS